MKILFLISSLEVGGAERQLAALAGGLRQRGHDVTVLTFYDRGPLSAEMTAQDVTVQSLHKTGRWDIVGFAWRLTKAVRDMRPDIVHSYLTVPNLVAACLRPFMPTQRLVWGIRYANLDLSAYDRLSRLTYRLQPYLARFVNLTIANSQAGSEMAVGEGYPRRRVTVVPNGIDTERFMPKSEAASALSSSGGPLIGVVARLDPMKDHENFLRAAALIRQERPDTHFVCIGGGPEKLRAKLQTLATKLGIADRVDWTGAVADMPAAYRTLDLCVLSSAYGEGFPNVIAEAMSCGIRCAVTDAGDAAAIVGKTGRVVPPRQPEALARAVLDLLDPEKTSEMPDPRARIVTNFSMDQMIERTETVLRKLAS